MTLKTTMSVLFSLISFASCTTGTVSIVNEKKGTLKGAMKLVNTGERKYLLDSVTAPRPAYIQLYTDDKGKMNLTFLNQFANAIYLYDYATSQFIKKIAYKKDGPKPIAGFSAYYIKNMDSIYLLDRSKNIVMIADTTGHVASNISLINNMDPKNPVWTYLYPQFLPLTASPMLVTKDALIFTGQYIWSVPKAIIDTFRFTTNIHFTDNHVTHAHGYPNLLYGFDFNWGRGFFTGVYADLSAKEGEIVYSFPISHDVYIAAINDEGYRTLYAGSNEAGTITSFDKDLTTKKSLPDDDLIQKICQTDLYTAIKYDKYRKVYYRFLTRAIPDATKKTSMHEKPITVIIFDENFHYLGETTLGKWKNYYWENSFITEEGLNIEYIEDNDVTEDRLIIKVFSLIKH